MATAAISPDLERHVSAIIVVLDIYPQMMREMIINLWPPGTISQLVRNVTRNQNHPFTRSLNDFDNNIIGKLDTEGYSRCDVSLLYKLIRHFSLVDTPTRQWGNRPSPGDVNGGDDVERMKRNRNEIFHRPRGNLSEDEKHTFFQESVGIARRIDDLIGRPANGFEYRILSLKIYSVTREKYIQILEKYNDLQERFRKISENIHVDLYYGNDIAAKFEPGNVDEPSGVTNCSIYIRDPNMDVSKVIEKLDEVKQKLNEGNFDIKLRGSENKCLLVHIEIDNKCFAAKELLHEAIESFLQMLFRLTSLDQILRSPVEVVLAESDNTYGIDNIKTDNTVDSFEDIHPTDRVLKLDVAVKDNVFQSNAHLYQHVNEFCNKIFHLTNQKRPTNDSSLAVVMTVQKNNDEQIYKRPEKSTNEEQAEDMSKETLTVTDKVLVSPRLLALVLGISLSGNEIMHLLKYYLYQETKMSDSVDYSNERGQADNISEDSHIKPLTLPVDKEFHVFISYKSDSPDCAIALKIEELLRNNGYKCCLHERDFEPGDYIVNNIVKYIERSVKVVFLLSESSKSSEWCQFELSITENIHMENKGYKPIILKLDDCILPDTLRHYTYLSADTPVDKWINRLAKAINDQTDHLLTNRRNIKFVAVPCINYNRGIDHSIQKCRYPHVCVKYIIGDQKCDETCGKNHDLLTNQSRESLADLGFITDGDEDSLLKSYRQQCKEILVAMPYNTVTGPCCYYNHEGCMLGDSWCPFPHICLKWFLGKCVDQSCEFSHDILNEHTKHLLKIFKIDVNQPEDKILDRYREIYPHKQYLMLPAHKVSKINFLQENWLYVLGGCITFVVITSLVVHRFQKSGN